VAGLVGRPERSVRRNILVVVCGFIVGALLTKLMTLTLPTSAARQFFITSVETSLGPLSADLNVIALTIGPLILRANFLSVVGILLIAWFARSLL
jgi:hypothetical protein